MYDNEGPRHSLQSKFFNDLYAFDFERKRWYALGLKSKAVLGGNTAGGNSSKKMKKVKKLQADKHDGEGKREGDVDEEEEEAGEEESDGASVDDGEESKHGGDDDDDDDRKYANGNYFGYINENGDIEYVQLEEEEGDAIDMKYLELSESELVAIEQQQQNVFSFASSSSPSLPAETSLLASSVENMEITSSSTMTLSPLEAGSNTVPPPPSFTVLDSYKEAKDVSQLEYQQLIDGDDVQSELHLNSNDDMKHQSVENKTYEEHEFIPNHHLPVHIIHSFFHQSISEPTSRINPCLLMRGCSLYVYGGITEIGDIEVTLDDCWSLDLNKRDSWKRVLPGRMHQLVWKCEVGEDRKSVV